MSRQLKTVKSNPLASRIKKVMQNDEDVGKIAQGAPVLVARAVEIFLTTLCEGTAKAVKQTNARTAVPGHLKAFVTSQPKLDFLADKFAAVPDYVEDEVTKEAPVKKQRSGGDDDKGLSSPSSSSGRTGRGRGRGRTRGRGSVRISGQDSQRGLIKSEQQDSVGLDAAMPEAQQVRQQDATAAELASSGCLPESNSTLEDCSTHQTTAQASPHTAQAGQAIAVESAATLAMGKQASDNSTIPGGAADQQQQPGLGSPAASITGDLASQRPKQASAGVGEPHPSGSATLSLPGTVVDMLPEEDDYDADE